MSGPRLDRAAWQRAEPLLDELLELEPAARAARLEALAASDALLARHVRDLLAATETEELLPRPAAEIAALLGGAADAVPSRLGERLGPFRIRYEIGRGGMGAVYAAERVEGGFEQQVAVKVLKRGLDSEHVLGRFLAERQILARLEHPHIAHLLDGGISDDGLPWFALERVDGQPITAHVERSALPLTGRLKLFLDVCSAVTFAHGQRVVHRDIKPSNVLVSSRGEVKLLDFGIAKLLDPTEERLTRTGMGVMTPQYAAPEQLAGLEVTMATDVWQLGRLLREMLRPPLPRDLERIVAHACHDEPGRRYVSAGGLADDLRRFLDGRPVLARGDSPVYRASRFLRRHRSAAGVAALALLALSMLAILLRIGGRPDAPAASGFALISIGGTSQQQPALSPHGDALAFVSEDRHGVAQVWTQRLDGSETVVVTSGRVPAARPRWSRDDRIVFERLGQGIWRVPAGGGAEQRLVERGSNPNLSGDGRWLVYERPGEGVFVARSDGSGERLIAAIPETWYTSWAHRHPALSPDGREIVYFLAVAGPFGDFWRVPVAGGTPQRLTFDQAEGGTPAWDPDGRSVIVSSSRDGARTLWRVAIAGSAPQPLTAGAGEDSWPELSADGRRLFYTNARTAYVIKLRDPATGRDTSVLSRRAPILSHPVVSPAGDRIAFFGGPRNGTSRIFSVRIDGSDLRQVTSGEAVDQIQPQWSADGRTLYFYEDYPRDWIVAPDGSITSPSGKPALRAIPSGGGIPREVLRNWIWEREEWTQVHPTGLSAVYTRYASVGSPSAAIVRDLSTGGERALPLTLRRPEWSPDGSRLAGVTAEGRGVNCRSDGSACVDLGAALAASWSSHGRAVVLRREGATLDDPQNVAVDAIAVPAAGGPEQLLARLAPLRRFCDGISVAPGGAIAWVAYERGKQELWSARLTGSPSP
jgi:Tol biopolymer transport system component